MKNLVFDIIDSNRPNSIPQHLLVSGNEGAGKTCLVESLASELLSRGYQVIKFLYPHCNVVTADDIINKVDVSNNAETQRQPQLYLYSGNSIAKL